MGHPGKERRRWRPFIPRGIIKHVAFVPIRHGCGLQVAGYRLGVCSGFLLCYLLSALPSRCGGAGRSRPTYTLYVSSQILPDSIYIFSVNLVPFSSSATFLFFSFISPPT